MRIDAGRSICLALMLTVMHAGVATAEPQIVWQVENPSEPAHQSITIFAKTSPRCGCAGIRAQTASRRQRRTPPQALRPPRHLLIRSALM
jgi:hypothetical protein